MVDRCKHDNALIEEVEVVRRDLVDLDFGALSDAWLKLSLINAPREFRDQVAEQCLATAQRLTDLAQNLVKLAD